VKQPARPATIVPPRSRPSRTLRAASRWPAAILDRRSARRPRKPRSGRRDGRQDRRTKGYPAAVLLPRKTLRPPLTKATKISHQKEPTERPSGGRHHPGTTGGIIPEQRAASCRNRWAASSESAAQARGNCAIVRNVGFRTRHPAARGEVQAAPGASVGWAQPRRPVYAPLSATWLGTPPGPPRTTAADRAARCRAEPERRGRVGVAQAIRICALVHNISQAWGVEPARLVDLHGLGNTP